MSSLRMDVLYRVIAVLTSAEPRPWGQGEKQALVALFRELQGDSATDDQLLDLGYSIDNPEGTKIRDLIHSLPDAGVK